MNRRSFIQNATKYSLLTGLPYILPSGRLFAATGERKIKHVVFCLFAGGIRNFESLDKREGNLMPNILTGDEPFAKDIAPGIVPMPKVLDRPLQESGTLFANFRYKSKVTLHYHGHATAITGKYCNAVNLMRPIHHPTVFELFRKHSPYNVDAINTWWVSDQAGPFPYLQFSEHSKYGKTYGANMIQPSSMFQFNFSNGLNETDMDHVGRMLSLLQDDKQTMSELMSRFPLINSAQNREQIRELIYSLYENYFQSGPSFWNLEEVINDDLVNMFTAAEILKKFHPNLLVVNMQDSDIVHSNFTAGCKNLHKADYALGKLWKEIQSDAILRDNTVLVAVPEFGRNATPNTIRDGYGRLAVDHTGEEYSQRMFCLIAGPPDVIQQNKVVHEEIGESIDVVPTIANLLGFDTDIPSHYLNGKILQDALV